MSAIYRKIGVTIQKRFFVKKHLSFFFDWFEDKRKEDGLYYSVRKINKNEMLSQGCIFLGTDYIAVPLVNHSDERNRTASVQFVYGGVDNSYSVEVVSRNLADPKCKNPVKEKEFCKKVVAFIELMYKYAKENGGRILNPDENKKLFSSRYLLKPADVKESLFVAHQSQHRPKNNEYEAKLYFNESTPEAALEKFYAFWKEHGIQYWSEYFKNPDDAIVSEKLITPWLSAIGLRRF